MSEARKYFDDINDMEEFLREVFCANNGASFDKDQLRKRIIGLVKKSPLQQKVEEAEIIYDQWLINQAITSEFDAMTIRLFYEIILLFKKKYL